MLAISQQSADRLGVKVGSTITFAAQDQQFTATVVALTKADGQHAYSRAEFTLDHAALKGLPVIWSGGVHVKPEMVSPVSYTHLDVYKRQPQMSKRPLQSQPTAAFFQSPSATSLSNFCLSNAEPPAARPNRARGS